ncbi:flagellar motor protein MotB [Rhodoferax lacus]|uniref:Flagellar motor protein MotB n=1 Tax=Rhodoferax lacus TaxID=2184758 RepID=A0A3E1RDP2_9BURK|nr:OmpA family protein [Rhodoferax lacus]RFO97142.1 flagellar motor protein MotB [Rhodoferax lacus]
MTHTSKILFSVIALAALQACTTVPVENPTLASAQQEYQTAQNTPAVTTLASAELRDAQLALDQAKTAWGKQEKRSEVDHLAYIASKKVAIAQELGNQRLAEKSIAEAQGRRTQTLLVARTLEAESAQRTAETAQRSAEAAQRSADASKLQAAVAIDASVQARQDTLAAEARATQLKAQLAELDAKQTDRGMVVTIGDLLFDNNSAVLKPGAGSSVQRLGAFLKAYPMRNALIEGYTDSVGTSDSNLSLSQRRAESVKAALLATGVVGERLAIRGYGEGFPVGSNQTADGRVTNRRVEVILSDDSGKIQSR